MSVIVNARFLTQPITGVQKFAIEISVRLKKLVPEVIFVAPPHIKHHALAQELEVKLIGKLNSHLWEQLELPWFLSKIGNPLLISFANTAPAFYKPQFVTIHDLAFKINPAWFSKAFVLLYNFLIPRLTLNAEKVITVSASSKNELIETYNLADDKVKIVYNAVNKVELPALPDIKSKYQLNKYILAVGSIDPRKNLGNLIKAFNVIKSQGYKLVIIGGKNKVFADLGLSGNLNENIVFTGYVSDLELVAFYSQAELFVYPSLYEGFGIPPLEAMAYECPTMVSDINSLREVCGEASVFVNPKRVDEIAETMDKVLNNEALKLKLIAAGKKQVAKYSWDQSANEIVFLINKYLNKKSGN